jgi:glycine C-acetyltransferase
MPASAASLPLDPVERLLRSLEGLAPAILRRPGKDFSQGDCLGLDRHPALALPLAAGPVAAAALQDRLARFLGMPRVGLYGSGTQAIRQGLGALIQPGDRVIVDAGSPWSAFDMLRERGARLVASPGGSVEAVARRLRRLDTGPGALWVFVAAVSGRSSVMADLAELLPLCQAHGARLAVDVTHDLGALGQGGRGVAELQDLRAAPDVVLGSLRPSFRAQGGFLALADASLGAPAPGLAPDRAARALAALDLIDSAEGRKRRRLLHGGALRLRNQLMAAGVPVLGQPSALVPVRLPPGLAEARTRAAARAGFALPLMQSPAVGRMAPRWLLHLSVLHGLADIDELAELVIDLCRPGPRLLRPRTARVLAP